MRSAGGCGTQKRQIETAHLSAEDLPFRRAIGRIQNRRLILEDPDPQRRNTDLKNTPQEKSNNENPSAGISDTLHLPRY